jgi:hypothetical protein
MNPAIFRRMVQELPASPSPELGLDLNISPLGSEYGISCKLGGDSLCDCSELSEPYRRYRLHFFPEIPSSFILDVPQHVHIPGKLCQIDSTMEWYVTGFSRRIVCYDALMVEDRTSGNYVHSLLQTLRSGRIPQGDIAVIPTSDPVLTRALLHLGASISPECPFDLEIDWKTLVRMAESGAIVQTIKELEALEGKIDFIESPLPYRVKVSRDEFPGIVAAFFNNAALPGAGMALAMADLYISKEPEELTVEYAHTVLESMDEWWFDYYRGRRMKVYLGSPDKPRNEIYTESFDQCAFPGAGRYLIDRYRRTGEVSLCLQYFADEDGSWKAKRLRD